MSTTPATDVSSGTSLESATGNAVADGSLSVADDPSSYTLKLFRHQGLVAYADRNDPTFRTPSDPSVYTTAIRVLNILEVSTVVATYLLPRRNIPRDPIEENHRRETHLDVTSFSRVCTSLYMSAMRALYRHVYWLPSLWCVLIDKFASLEYPFTDMVVSNQPILLLVLRLQYDNQAVLKDPESTVAYKFRRFLFITAQVRALHIDNADFSRDIFQYVTALLPKYRRTLLPGLRTASWIDDEFLVPTFLSSSLNDSNSRATSPSPGNSDEPDGSPRGTQSLRSWVPFDMNAIRTLNLQMHMLISPRDETANHDLFFASIQQLRNQCRSVFPRLDRLLFLICRHKYHKPTMLSRIIVNILASFVLETGAVPTSANIPQPPSTLPFKKEHLRGGAFLEGIAINSYLSHAPARNVAGDGPTPSDAHPIFSAHLVTATGVLAMACTTNMTPSSLEERHTISRILSPAVDYRGLETLILHFETISLRLSHGDLTFIGKSWKNLRTLDLRFKTIVTNEHLDIIQANSVQFMTRPDFADRLKRIHLPELDVRNFRNLMKYRQDTLTTLTSSVLHFNDDEIKDVCIALLTAYPSLTTVTGPGSAPEWRKFAEVLGSLREKHRVERNVRDQWIRADAALVRVHQ